MTIDFIPDRTVETGISNAQFLSEWSIPEENAGFLSVLHLRKPIFGVLIEALYGLLHDQDTSAEGLARSDQSSDIETGTDRNTGSIFAVPQ